MKITTNSSTIFDAIKQHANEQPRPHLGASIIGHNCDRWLWYSFRWIAREDFDGRMLRLFRRGQLEEQQIVTDMRRAGFKVNDIDPNTRKQYSFKDGHFAGSMDGIIQEGVLEAPTKQHVMEIKTHSLKSYTALEKDGVQKSKPQHYAQMQVYMGATGIDRALYVAICKDNDSIYTERVRFDLKVYEQLNAKAQRIVASDRIPEPMTADPTWFECKFCSAASICHGKQHAKDAHCRSCSHITFKRDGTTHCAHWDAEVPFDAQLGGCEAHILHPDLVPWNVLYSDKVYWKIDGVDVPNGEPDATTFSSKEIVANPKACASLVGDKFAMECRTELGARVCD